MKINVNGNSRDVKGQSVSQVLDELELGGAVVATALNGNFVPVERRAAAALRDGDSLEVLAPMQGG